jgi:hypothetical protein
LPRSFQLARLDQTEELLVGDIGARPVRHRDGEVLGELKYKQQRCCGCGRTRSAKGKNARGRRSRWGGKVPNQRSTCGFKGGRHDPLPSKPSLPCQRDFHPRAHAPTKQPPACATPRFPRNTDLQSLRAVIMERSPQSRRPRCLHP